MIDRIKIQLAEVFLSNAAVDSSSSFYGFKRKADFDDCDPGKTIALKFRIDGYPVVRISAKKLIDGRWVVRTVEANLPALIHGHNGRPLANGEEFHLSLTRLRFIVSKVVDPEDLGGVLPGIGLYNHGWISEVECLRQIDDQDNKILTASHFARLKHQQKPTGVFFGESSAMFTRHTKVSIYDKRLQLQYGEAHPSGSSPIRLESTFRNADHLAKEVKATQLYAGNPGPLVATLCPETAYRLLDRTLSRLVGFGWKSGLNDIESLSKPARTILCGLAGAIHEPDRLNLAIANYNQTVRPGVVTRTKVERELRAYAVASLMMDEDRPVEDLLQNLRSLPVSEVRWPFREQEFHTLMTDIGAPSVADPDIVQAWSKTSFLPSKPSALDLTGPVAPGPLPWRKIL